MDSLELQFKIKRAGFNQSDIAKIVGVSRAMVSKVISGDARSERVINFIKTIVPEYNRHR